MDQTVETPKPLATELDKPAKTNGHSEELVDHYWGSLNHVIGLIRASEIKAGLILSFYGILFNFIYENVVVVLAKAVDYKLLYVLLGFWTIATMTSIFYCIRCFMPRIEMKFDKNVFFFGDVITKFGNIDEFSKNFYKVSLDEEELFFQLGQQIYINSKIASQKFKNVNRAIRLLAVGLVILLITGVYFLIVSL